MPRPLLYFRRRFFRFRAASLPKRRGTRRLRLLIVPVLLILLCVVFVLRLRPVVIQMATASATNSITTAVNKAIRERMQDGSLEYSKLVTLQKNDAGQITALMTNMSNVNNLQADITNRVIEILSDKSISEIRIPLGNIIGGTLLSGRGPRIPINILSVSYASASFSNEFTSAGINQTRHQIVLLVTVKVEVLIPGYKTSTSVSSEVNVAETIIVGGVPETYTYFEEGLTPETNWDKYDILS